MFKPNIQETANLTPHYENYKNQNVIEKEENIFLA